MSAVGDARKRRQGEPTPDPEQMARELSALRLYADRMDAENGNLRDIITEVLTSPEFAQTVAKMSWDRGEREYWDSEADMRPFDPTVTELDSDDCDRGREWLGTVTEILADAHAALLARQGPR